MKTIQALVDGFQMDIKKTVKTLFVIGKKHELIALVLRGDHSLNPIKAEKHPLIAAPLQWASEEKMLELIGCGPGSLGPVGLNVPIIVDRDAAILSDFMCGANEEGVHLKNVNWERDLPLPLVADLRTVEKGDPSPDGEGNLQLTRGIEVGHIFQLGDKYSAAMEATVLDELGQKVPLQMGCYGMGVSRIVAAAIEQNHDTQGIVWPEPMAPFQIALIPIGYEKPEVKEITDHIYHELLAHGFEVLLDDREERPGVKFADMELIGVPHRLVVSERGLAANTVEYKNRREAAAYPLEMHSITETMKHRIHTEC